ncbi:MAG: hypothetical protein NG747_06345 [Candidatus Brocadia sp.]|nr:hypothetical protein [Candidatus Brocadia sp.]
MPMGVIVHEALDTLDIRGRDAASSYCHGCFHDGEYNKWNGVKPGKNAPTNLFLSHRGENCYKQGQSWRMRLVA